MYEYIIKLCKEPEHYFGELSKYGLVNNLVHRFTLSFDILHWYVMDVLKIISTIILDIDGDVWGWIYYLIK